MSETSTFMTLEIHTRLGRASRWKLQEILQDSLEKFLGEGVTIHEMGPIRLTGHRTSDGSSYALNLHPAQVMTYQPTHWYKWEHGQCVMCDPWPGTRVEMYGTDGLYTVTVREPFEEVDALLQKFRG